MASLAPGIQAPIAVPRNKVKSAVEITDHPSPNYGPRRGGIKPNLVVLHYTAMESAAAALDRLCDAAAEVSAHYLITGKGVVIRMVAEDQRAWHAGQGSWAGQDDINSRSIGIELDNRGNHPFSEPQMTALEGLLHAIKQRWSIRAVIGHSDLAPGRKVDPGPHFDWARLARQELVHVPTARPTPPPVTAERFMRTAAAAGYPTDVPFETLLHSTRLRCAPWRKGPLTADDFALPFG